jgi:ribosomal protein S18 acetylase RimI-like enzyme
MKSYTIRPAAPSDAPQIAEVAHRTWHLTYAQTIAIHNRQRFLSRAYSPRALYEAITRKPGWFYVALRNDALVGFAHYLPRSDGQGELIRLYIHPDHQRQGIGRRFLAIGAAALIEANISHCYVSVELENPNARAFYRRFKFKPHREHARFLGDQLIRLTEYIVAAKDLLAATGTADQLSQSHLNSTTKPNTSQR